MVHSERWRTLKMTCHSDAQLDQIVAQAARENGTGGR